MKNTCTRAAALTLIQFTIVIIAREEKWFVDVEPNDILNCTGGTESRFVL